MNQNMIDYNNIPLLFSLLDKDIAKILDSKEDEYILKIYNEIDFNRFVKILPYCKNINHILDLINNDELIINNLDIYYIKKINRKRNIKDILNDKNKKLLKDVLNCGRNRIGYYIKSNYKTCNCNSTKEEILNNLDLNISYIYLVDDNNKYVSAIKISDLLCNSKISDEIIKKYPSLNMNSLNEELIFINKKYKLNEYPVVDIDNRIIGILDNESIIKIIEREFDDDYYKMAGILDEKETKYIKESMDRRMPWLLVSCITMLSVSIALIAFSNLFKKYPVIPIYSVFILMISSFYAVMENSYVLNVTRKKKLKPLKEIKYIYDEIKKGLIISLLFGVLAFIIIYFYLIFTNTSYIDSIFYGTDALKFAGLIALSLQIAIMEGMIIGIAVPNITNRLGYDPSISSTVLITTLTDIITLFTFYSLINFTFNAW